MVSRVNVSMRSRGLYEIERHSQSAGYLQPDQCYGDHYLPQKL